MTNDIKDDGYSVLELKTINETIEITDSHSGDSIKMTVACWDELAKAVSEKMQPYVKPMLTWIDASERLPEEDGKYLVCFGLLKSVANSDVDNFNAKTKQWEFYNKDDLPRVIAWMPIPEFSTMQNLHKGERCE